MTRATILVYVASFLIAESEAALLRSNLIRSKSSLEDISNYALGSDDAVDEDDDEEDYDDEDCQSAAVPERQGELDPFDCYTGDGEDYIGLANMGESGRNCMNWVEQGKFKKGHGVGSHNYCRNPNGRKRPWCFTIDPQKKWEYCTVAECKDSDLKKRKAYEAPKGSLGKGTKPCKYKPPKVKPFKKKHDGRACMDNRGKKFWLIDMERVKAADPKKCFEKCQAKIGTEFFTFFKKTEKEDEGKNCGCYRECILVDKDLTTGDPDTFELV